MSVFIPIPKKGNAKECSAAKSLQSCPTPCDPIDGSPPGSAISGILQARALEWVAIFFSNAWKWKVKVEWLSHVRPSATPWTAAFQAPLSIGFSRQEYWSGVPLPSPIVELVKYKEVRTAPYTYKFLGYRNHCFFSLHVSSGKTLLIFATYF